MSAAGESVPEPGADRPIHEPVPCTRVVERWLRRAAETCVALALLLPPFVFGAREARGQMLLAILVMAASALAGLGRLLRNPPKGSWRRAEVLVPLAGLVLTVWTWLPLPPRLVQLLSPGMGRLLPAWTNGSLQGLPGGGWPYLSMAPALSHDATCLFLLYVLLFWVTIDSARTPDAVRRLVSTLFLAGTAVAVVGLAHWLFWNGRFYGTWQLWWVQPDRQVRAPFTNRNHFAGFLALALGPGLIRLVGLLRRRRSTGFRNAARAPGGNGPADLTIFLTIVGLALMGAAILLAQSRGGIVTAVVVLAAAMIGLWRGRASHASSLVACAVMGLAVLALVLTFGSGPRFQRLGQLLAGRQPLAQLANGRLELWQADLHALLDFPLVGSGTGTHPYVYPLYYAQAHDGLYTHAENCYVQILMECGLAGGLLLALAILSVARWCLQRRVEPGYGLSAWNLAHEEIWACGLAVGSALLGALVHGAVDFVWYVPAYAATMAVLAGLACSLYRIRKPAFLPRSPCESKDRLAGRMGKPFWLGAGATCWIVLASLLGRHYVRLVKGEHAWNTYSTLLAAAPEGSSREAQRLQERARWLAEACRHQPGQPDYLYRLALVERERFLAQADGQSAAHRLIALRQAMQRARWATPEEARAWLAKQYGSDLDALRHSQVCLRQSVQSCPLLGLAYLQLAQLCFLDGPGTNAGPYLQQALLIRPNDAAVCLQAGTECWLAGDGTAARQCWQRACRLQPDYQMTLLPVLAAHLAVTEVVALVHPDFDGLQWLARDARTKGDVPAQRYLAREASRTLQEDPRRWRNPDAWTALYDLYRGAGLYQEAGECLEKAVQLDGTRLSSHLCLIRWLSERGQWTAALQEASKARQLFPTQPEVHGLHEEILQHERLRHQGKTSVNRSLNRDREIAP